MSFLLYPAAGAGGLPEAELRAALGSGSAEEEAQCLRQALITNLDAKAVTAMFNFKKSGFRPGFLTMREEEETS